MGETCLNWAREVSKNYTKYEEEDHFLILIILYTFVTSGGWLFDKKKAKKHAGNGWLFYDCQGIGDHNFCRNPGKIQDREFCFVSKTKAKFCKVRTCGEDIFN